MVKNFEGKPCQKGDTIPEAKSINDFNSSKLGYWCYYNFEASNGNKYGKGWHIPTKQEWQTLIDNSHTDKKAGIELKVQYG